MQRTWAPDFALLARESVAVVFALGVGWVKCDSIGRITHLVGIFRTNSSLDEIYDLIIGGIWQHRVLGCSADDLQII